MAIIVSVVLALLCTDPVTSAKVNNDAELCRLWKERAALAAEQEVAANPKSKDALLRLASAKKLPGKPGALMSLDQGAVGYSPEPLRAIEPVGEGNELLSMIGTNDVVVRSLGSPVTGTSTTPGLLVVSGTTTIESMVTKYGAQGAGQSVAPKIRKLEKRSVPVLTPIDVAKELKAVKSQIAELNNGSAAPGKTESANTGTIAPSNNGARTGAAAYDDFIDPVRELLAKEWETEIGRVKRAIAKEQEAARAAKNAKERQHYEDSVKERQKRLIDLQRNDPPYVDFAALKKKK